VECLAEMLLRAGEAKPPPAIQPAERQFNRADLAAVGTVDGVGIDGFAVGWEFKSDLTISNLIRGNLNLS